jgi:hypothetical protein
MPVKSSTLCVASKEPGVCGHCRHANQGTADFAEKHVFCGWVSGARHPNYTCDVKRHLPRESSADGNFAEYFLYEPYDGTNGTWGRRQDTRLLAPDASAELRKALQADIPFIAADK